MPELSVPSGIVSADPRIEVDGQEEDFLSLGALSILVEEDTAGLYRCEARFGDWGARTGGGNGTGHLYLDRELLDFGKTFAVTMGSGEGQGRVFQGRISALEAQFGGDTPPSLVVLAEDRAQDLRMVRRTRVFETLTDAEVFEQIAREHGLQPEIDVDGPTHTVLAQVNQSDLAFIRERARWLDAEVWLDDRTLHVQSRSRRSANSDELTLHLGRGLLEFSAMADLARQHTSVVVSGWDVAGKARISHEADDAALGSELNGDQSGASILRDALGERVERIVHEAPGTSAEVQAMAEAAFRAQARLFVTGTGVARGDARLRVGAKVQLTGSGDMFDGVYYVSEVRHVYRRRPGGGYTTQFSVEKPGLGS